MKNEQNNPFRIQCDIWLARIGSAFAWFWLVLWVLIGMVGLGDLMNGKSAETVDKVMPFVSFGFAAANMPLLLASRKTKRLIKDFRLYCPVLAHEPDKSIPQLAAALNKPLEEVKGQLTIEGCLGYGACGACGAQIFHPFPESAESSFWQAGARRCRSGFDVVRVF